jgi:hypothetical protein
MSWRRSLGRLGPRTYAGSLPWPWGVAPATVRSPEPAPRVDHQPPLWSRQSSIRRYARCFLVALCLGLRGGGLGWADSASPPNDSMVAPETVGPETVAFRELLLRTEQQITSGHAFGPQNDNALATWREVIKNAFPDSEGKLFLLQDFVTWTRQRTILETAAGRSTIAEQIALFADLGDDLLLQFRDAAALAVRQEPSTADRHPARTRLDAEPLGSAQPSLPQPSPVQPSPSQPAPSQPAPSQASSSQPSSPQVSLPQASSPEASSSQASFPQASPLQASPLQASSFQASSSVPTVGGAAPPATGVTTIVGQTPVDPGTVNPSRKESHPAASSSDATVASAALGADAVAPAAGVTSPLGAPVSPTPAQVGATADVPGTSIGVAGLANPNNSASPGLPSGVHPPGSVAAARTEDAATAQEIKRGNDMLAIKDISAARKLFASAASAGSARAATALARTYDPLFFSQLGVIGFKADPSSAILWYGKAAALGDPEAATRVQTLRGEAAR